MKRIAVIGNIFLITILFGCHTGKKTATSAVELNTLKVSANNNPNQIYRASATRVWDLVNTSAILRFNFKEKTAEGRVNLMLKPHLKDTSLIVLDAKGMQIDTVAIFSFIPLMEGEKKPMAEQGKKLMLLPHTYDGKELKITLPKPMKSYYAPNQEVLVLYLTYKAMPYADSTAGGSTAISEDRGLYFINTDNSIPGKPVQIWTQGETESNSHWLPTIDKPNQRTTTSISLIVPDTMQTLSNGELKSSERLGNGLRMDHWEMNKPIQPYAIMFTIGKFSIVTDEHNGVPVDYYVEPQYADAAKDIFKNTPAMIDYFSKVTGVPYPWNKYSQIVVRDYVSGAMENTSASLFGETMNGTRREVADKPGNEDVVSHELFHQWFGDYVTAESWSNVTLNESFATYGEVLWRKASQGPSSADELAADDLNRYLQSTEMSDPPLVRYYYPDKEVMFDRVSYQKGGAILRYMNCIMGDDAFSKSMQRYLTRNALHPAEAAQWRLAVEEVTGQDWMQFFKEWYFQGGHPEIFVNYNYDDAAHRLRVITRQWNSPDSNAIYHLPLKAGILENGRIRVIDWAVNKRVQVDTVWYSGNTRPLFLPDYHRVLPGFLREGKTYEQYRQQIVETSDYNSKRRAIVGAFSMRNNRDSAINVVLAALKDTIPGIRYFGLNQLGNNESQRWKDALLSQVKYLATQDSHNRIRTLAIKILGRWRSSADEAMHAVNDESYAVGGAALRALLAMRPDTTYTIAKQIMQNDPRGDLESAVWDAIAEKGVPSDISLYKAATYKYYGNKKIVFAYSLYDYALATKDDAAFQQAVKLLAGLIPTESIHNYRTAIGILIFSMEGYYNNLNTKEGKAIAANRLPVIRETEQQILAREVDTNVVEQYKIYQSREVDKLIK